MIDAVIARLHERLSADQASVCEAFVRQYYKWVPVDDLIERTALDLYGAALAHWNLAQQRPARVAKVRVYNPEFQQHGWQSPHTALEIVSDDMPFLVDSVTMELASRGYALHLVIHPVMRVLRDAEGRLIAVQDSADQTEPGERESIIHIELDREPDRALRERLQRQIERVLSEVRVAVEDWQPMRAIAQRLAEQLDSNGAAPTPREELLEARSFLRWLADGHFTFLGYRDYRLITGDGRPRLEAVPESGLGILRGSPATPVHELTDRALALAVSSAPLVLTKANSVSTIHRPAYLDYIGIKRFGPDGRVTGEDRFLGLYTTAAYNERPYEIPVIRGKVRHVLERAGFPPDSHDEKALHEVCENYPRDSLFQIEPDELFRIATGLLGLGERQRVRMFAWPDALRRFVVCLVCIPRDRFNTANRVRASEILLRSFGGTHVDWNVQLSESLLARVHYIVHCPDGVPEDYDEAAIEQEIVAAMRSWGDDLREALVDEHGEEQGLRLLKRYESAFPAAYRDDWVARSAVGDIARIEQLADRGEPLLYGYRLLEAPPEEIRCKLFSNARVSLSDALPTFEHMGVQVVDERPYEISPAGRGSVWLYDFGMRYGGDLEQARELFQDAFLGVWRGELEDDRLNTLVLSAALTGRQVTIVRAVTKYLRQAGIPFSNRYMEQTVIGHPEIARLLVELFYARLDPEARDEARAEAAAASLNAAIDAVHSLDEDRILRNFLSVVIAILRTNFFVRDASGAHRPYLSFKLDPTQIPLLPPPRPRFEIFVYSPRVEGIHLRGGRVARGGLRWSDRREDFRTEVLGLMKAQMVKNALIVPVGSKGGFVVKRPPATGGRDALQAEGIACYKLFLSGLLDLTDNIVGGRVVPPDGVVRYDGDDPYLVVAADKGTASFSDIANGVSADYGFWLGDAFASGGSQGYDHKAMGITARGAWEAVKRHFRELGTDIQTSDFTVVGIGDMAGDVFGNGMLLSPHIRLVAAFNHMHVFLDPDPDAAVGFAERKRLFELPRSTWDDYDRSLISAGGGVFERTAKSIPISEQARRALSIDADELAPADLIRELLSAPVDLLWNGGIGTYVKSSAETNAEVGDKANDVLRVDGAELRCRVVGEGGNLGFTQRGRIEYALAGGRIYTDAIDNVAGVNCSDHEVNIKILLGALVDTGDMTHKQRNQLLAEMTDAVAEQVLYGSYTQTQAISMAVAQAPQMIDVHARLIAYLEQTAGLVRELEFLPGPQEVAERKVARLGLTAPELAVVMAYCKIRLDAELLDSDLPEDPYLAHDLERYFPPPLPERYSERMQGHRLRREIIATVVANQLVDRAGTTFAFRLEEETGAPASTLARAYAVAREVYEMRPFWTAVEALDNEVDAGTLLAVLIEARRLVERATRWLVRANPASIDVAGTIGRYADGARALGNRLPELLEQSDRGQYDLQIGELLAAGVGEPLARRVASMRWMLSVFDIVEVANSTGRDQDVVTETYFQLGSRLQLNWLRDRIIQLPRNTRWQALARAALRDDLNTLSRALTQQVLEAGGPDGDSQAAITAWESSHGGAVERCLGMLADIQSSGIHDMTTLPVALREVRNLLRAAAGPDATQ